MGERLTVARVRSLAKPGRYAAGPTLYLNVAPGGTKSWIQRLTVNGKRRDLGLGGWPLVTLGEARDPGENDRIGPRERRQSVRNAKIVDSVTKLGNVDRPEGRDAGFQ